MSCRVLVALALRWLGLRPVRWLLTALALFLLTTLAALTVLLHSALDHTADRVLQAGPSLVISRVSAGGWAPIDVRDEQKLRSLAGVERVSPRLWGVLPGPPAVTVLASPQLHGDQALLGSGVRAQAYPALTLKGLDGKELRLTASASLSKDVDLVAFDLVLVSEQSARRLLLLGDGEATDLALASVRPEEDDALVPEVASSLGYPVRVVTRAQMRGAYRGQSAERAGLTYLTLGPALLALMLIVGIAAYGGPEAQTDVAKLKLLGWSTPAVVRLYLMQMLLVSGLSVCLGLASAYLLLFVLGGGPLVSSLLGWGPVHPYLRLDPQGAALAMSLVAGSCLMPCALASVLPALRLGRSDPADLLEAP